MVSLAETAIILVGSIDLSFGALVTFLEDPHPALTVDYVGVVGASGVSVSQPARWSGSSTGSRRHPMLRVPSFLVTLGMLSILSECRRIRIPAGAVDPVQQPDASQHHEWIAIPVCAERHLVRHPRNGCLHDHRFQDEAWTLPLRARRWRAGRFQCWCACHGL